MSAAIRSSDELPDHEGTVFVTRVPNAPFQILGRRDPRTDELCVGSLVFRSPTSPDPAEINFPFEVEFVTGKEAEQLIAKVAEGRLIRLTSGNMVAAAHYRPEIHGTPILSVDEPDKGTRQ